MRPKRLIISSGIVIAVAAVVLGAWMAWRTMHGTEHLEGARQAIPQAMRTFPPIEPGPADWPGWRGLTGDGKSPVTGIRKNWSGGLTKLWEVSFLCQGTHTATWSSPVVCGNRLVVPGRDARNDLVFCLDSGTGNLIWSKSYPAQPGTSHGPGPRHALDRSGPGLHLRPQWRSGVLAAAGWGIAVAAECQSCGRQRAHVGTRRLAGRLRR